MVGGPGRFEFYVRMNKKEVRYKYEWGGAFVPFPRRHVS